MHTPPRAANLTLSFSSVFSIVETFALISVSCESSEPAERAGVCSCVSMMAAEAAAAETATPAPRLDTLSARRAVRAKAMIESASATHNSAKWIAMWHSGTRTSVVSSCGARSPKVVASYGNNKS